MPGELVVEAVRGGTVEARHRVHLAVCDTSGRLVASAGDPHHVTFLRSAAKPLQALPIIEDGSADQLGLDSAAIAIACASHEGAPGHVSAVAALLAAAGVGLADLRPRGLHEPLGSGAARELRRAGRAPGPLHHNCSGNHALALSHARARGWTLGDYLVVDAPNQRAVHAAVEALAGEAPHLATDRCGMPAYALSLAASATAYARLAAGGAAPWVAACARVCTSMRAHPWLVGGDAALDTAAMRETPVVAKRGALGVICCANPLTGVGGALKVESGSDAAAEVALARLVHLVAGTEAPTLTAASTRPLRDGAGAVVGGWRVNTR